MLKPISPREIYNHLSHLDEGGDEGSLTISARYREEAQKVIADPKVSLPIRDAIADRLNEANHLLTLQTVDSEESY